MGFFKKALIEEHDVDAKLGHAKTSISYIGEMLGFIAAKKERSWKKPASGLFFIREVSNGVPAKEAFKKIESGQLDAEIKDFAKNHFKNLFEGKKGYWSK